MQERAASIAEISPHEPTLIAQAKSGDIKAHSKLFELYSPPLLQYLTSRLGPDNAPDALSDIFLKSYKGIPYYESQPNVPFRAWLFRIARNHVIDTWRRRSRTSTTPLQENQSRSEDNGHERKDKLPFTLQDIAQILTSRQREVFLLRHSGLSVKDTGEQLEIEENNVKVLSTKARKKIEEKFLTPKGFVQLRQLAETFGISENWLSLAAQRGRLSAFKLYNLYYSDSETVEKYIKNVRKAAQELSESNYIPISSLPYEECREMGLHQKSWGVIRRNDKLYISEENYQRFKQEIKPKKYLPRIKPTDPSLQPLTFFATTYVDYIRLADAARGKKLKAIKVRRF